MAQTLGIDWNVRLVDSTGTAISPSSVSLNDTVAAGSLTGSPNAALTYYYNANTDVWARARTANNFADGAAGGTLIPVAGIVYNGTTFDRMRTASGDGLAATGLAAAGVMLWNGATWDRAKIDSGGNARVVITASTGSTGAIVTTGGSDALATGSGALATISQGYLFNGTAWERERGNIDVTLLASAARTTTQTSADITTYNARGIHVVLDMTTVGTGSVTVTINGKDSVSGKYYLLLSGAAVTTNSTNVYKVYPGLPATANVSANDHIPRVIQIVVTANNANSATYSCGYSLLV